MDYLDRVNGALFIRNESRDSREPIARRMWWTVVRTDGWLPCWFDADSSGDYCRRCGQRKDTVTHDVSNGIALSGWDGNYGGRLSNGATFRVHIDPRAHAVRMEETPIPCPKVRAGIETRYYRESWQKYLKSSGWVNI